MLKKPKCNEGEAPVTHAEEHSQQEPERCGVKEVVVENIAKITRRRWVEERAIVAAV
jgi:hypothetical protein